MENFIRNEYEWIYEHSDDAMNILFDDLDGEDFSIAEINENLSDFMNSNSFRLRYYVEDLPNFFLKKDVSGEYPSGDTGGIVVNPDGGDTDLTGGITGIWQALVNLPKTILDGLIGLFVPDAEYFYNEDLENPGLWQRFSVFMQGKLGFLWDVLVFIPNLISTIIDVITSFTENWSVTIPDLKVPTMTGVEEVVFLSSFEWSPYDWINQKVEFRNLYELYLDIIDFFVYWGLIWFFVPFTFTVTVDFVTFVVDIPILSLPVIVTVAVLPLTDTVALVSQYGIVVSIFTFDTVYVLATLLFPNPSTNASFNIAIVIVCVPSVKPLIVIGHDSLVAVVDELPIV